MDKNKPVILAIVGESGVGKTYCADYIEARFGIPMILSHTERPPRIPDEKGHTFHDDDAYDNLNPDEIIAETKIDGYMYWCETKDVKRLNTYVIDEPGLIMLKRDHPEYDVHSLRIWRDYDVRSRTIEPSRLARDNFIFTEKDFDYNIINDGNFHDFHCEIRKVVNGVFGV